MLLNPASLDAMSEGKRMPLGSVSMDPVTAAEKEPQKDVVVSGAKLAESAEKRLDAGETESDIDALIRRLANDIESGRKVEPSETTLPAVDDQPAELEAVAPPLPSMPLEVPSKQGMAVGSVAVGSRAVSSKPSPPTMVQAAREVVDHADASPRTQTPAAKLAAIADALSDEQMDVYLETINGLEDYRAQHYEVSVRLRLADGEVLENDAFLSEARGTGLLPLLEAVKVSSTKRLAVQMMRRGRSGGFFTAIDGEALGDSQFGDDVDTIAGGDKDLATRLVLAFSQSDVRGLTKAQSQTLETIAALGFKFSIEEITDLDMDFEDLARRGFTFAKLDADVFLNGLPTGTSRVPPFDICQHLAKSGLTLIIGNVRDEVARAKILGMGAVLGQGELFGAPRPVRASVLKSTETRPQGSAAL